jgi:hypothetical protein|tara:strand:- start:738 stop:1055 length:318 start_codon:yes stop_codon:yes gene_type:complete
MKYQTTLIANYLNILEKEYNNINKISEIMFIYLYKNLEFQDVFLATLLQDGEPFDRKGCTGYINYLKFYLQNLNDYKKVNKVGKFVKYLSWNQKSTNMKKTALTY